MILSSGTRLGPYEIIAPLGTGATSEVYRAHDSRLGRDVALKLLGMGTPTAATKRFDQEAKAAAALNHPNVLSILDIGTEGERPYLVYELLEGRTVREVLDRGHMSMRDAVRFGLEIARGLAAVHDKGVIHRDLKPENLFITSEGGLKILDFGLARLRELRPAEQASALGDTRPGYILGSLGYLPPEQILGNPVDQRADLFSLGAVLYEMISGKRAFRGNSERQVLEAIIAHEPEALSKLVPSIPQRLQRIVERCLQKEPDDRVRSAVEVARQLEVVLEQLEGGETLVRLPRWSARIIAASILLASVLGASYLVGFRWPFGERPGPPPAAPGRLAVLPLTNLDGGEHGDAFNAGVVEMLTIKLSQVEEFRRVFHVISARDVQKECATTPNEVARLFGATLALTGTLRRTGDSTVVTLALSDTRSHLVISSRDASLRNGDQRPLDAVLVDAVAEMLNVPLDASSRRAAGDGQSTAPGAYDFYLQGLGYLRRFDRAENLTTAVELFQRALQRDGRFTLARAGLAEAEVRLYQDKREIRYLKSARANAERALAGDENLPEVHRTLALVEAASGDHERAVASFERALQIRPRDVDTLRDLAKEQDALGRLKDAEATFRRAIALEPNSSSAHHALARFYASHRRLDEAEKAYLHAIQLTPDNYAGYYGLGAVYAHLERTDEAERALRRSIDLRPNELAFSNLGNLRYYAGRYADAAEMYRKALDLNPNNERQWGNLADALRWSGQRAEAEKAYRKALSLVDERLRVEKRTPQALAQRAMYLVSSGDKEAALRDVAESLKPGPQDPVVLFRAGLVYEQAGQRDRALEMIQRAATAGYSTREMRRAPPLAELVRDPQFARIEGGKR